MMDSLLRERRSGHQYDDIHHWAYQRNDGLLFSPSSAGGSDMDWNDCSSRAIGGSFDEYH